MRTALTRLRTRVRTEQRLRLIATVAALAMALAACSGGAAMLTAGQSGASTDHSRSAVDAALPPVSVPAPAPVDTLPDPVPTTTSSTAPPVQPMGALHRVDAMVRASATISDQALTRITRIKGVQAIEAADGGSVNAGGANAFALGIAPDTFRNFTPAASAKVDQLWSNLASGGLAFSYEMAHERSLPLGGSTTAVPLADKAAAATAPPRWIGAFMATGLPDVDVVVDRRLSPELGLVANSVVLVSAPKADVWDLQQALRSVVPGADVELLRATPVVDTNATFLSAAQIGTIISAATSRVGMPYLWGGTGPSAFDCSGLVGWAFRAAGLDVPRTAAQLYLAGPRIDPKRAQPGDLLFWANEPDAPGYIDHVAIYLGGGKMVVAPHTGDFVKITAVPMNNFMGVVRLDPRLAGRVGGPRYSDLAGHS